MSDSDIRVEKVDLMDLSDPSGGTGIYTKMQVHCKAEGEDIYAYVMSAISTVEGESGKSIRTRNLIMTTIFEEGNPVQLYRGPITKINSVEYYSGEEWVSLKEGDDFRRIDTLGGQIVPAIGAVWPCIGAPVVIDYNVGLGYLDEKNFQAVAFLTAHYYKNREAVESGNKTPVVLPMAARDLINLIMDE